jgi:hypothetical protein
LQPANPAKFPNPLADESVFPIFSGKLICPKMTILHGIHDVRPDAQGGGGHFN